MDVRRHRHKLDQACLLEGIATELVACELVGGKADGGEEALRDPPRCVQAGHGEIQRVSGRPERSVNGQPERSLEWPRAIECVNI